MQLEGSSLFQSTRWSLIGRAVATDGELQKCREALDELLRIYMPALRAHLIRRRRCEPNRADDVLHDFIVQRILEKQLLHAADPVRGRFRNFLLKSLERFLIDRVRSEKSARRAPDSAMSINDLGESFEFAAEGDSEVFDSAWAETVVRRTLERLWHTCREEAAQDKWQVFCHRLLVPLLSGGDPLPYEKLVEICGYQQPKQAANALVTALRMFDRSLRSVIAEYAENEDQVNAELLDLAHAAAASSFRAPDLLTDNVRLEVFGMLASATQHAEQQMPLGVFFSLDFVLGSRWQKTDIQAMFDHTLNCPLKHILDELEFPSVRPEDASELSRTTDSIAANVSAATITSSTVGDLFRSTCPSIELLEAIKDYGKALSSGRDRVVPKVVGLAVYYLAIAVALVRCEIRLSRLKDSGLKAGLNEMTQHITLDESVAQTVKDCLNLLR